MTSPPQEAQRFGRSQTPESPRPVHIPEPANIPVLRNQMDPVFNDTATYNIPNVDQHFSFSDTDAAPTATGLQADEHDPVQEFLRSAEAESSIPQDQTQNVNQAPQVAPPSAVTEATVPEPLIATSNNPLNAEQIDRPSEVAHPALAEVALQVHAEVNGVHGTQDSIISQPATQPHQTGSGVDDQPLPNTVSQFASTAPAADAITAPTTAAAPPDPGPSTSSLPSAPGLPPKPPVQEQPADYANYQTNEPHQAQLSLSVPDSTQNSQSQPSTAVPPQDYAYTGSQLGLGRPYATTGSAVPQTVPYSPITGERPWTPRTQGIYDQFLEDERGYVTEGIWDKFPLGSRLFVGNLPSEKVTKRDLFHIFHRHGRLAQISIKQAYGFVQFLEAADCYRALEAQQGVEIRGRKIHLEVSKPQKNTRNANSATTKNTVARRRSRSPARRGSSDRMPGRNPANDFRDDRRRDDFRRTRSPSPPRNYRSRDEYRPGGGRHSPRSYASPRSPAFPQYPSMPQRYDEDSTLPLPRRAPQDVPDVQLLILDQNVPQAFINWVEDVFRSKGLKASTIWLSPRLPLQAVIKRQILEGVHGLVKLLQMNSVSQKLPLQVFDRSSGASNVKFNEYVDLDVNIAADIILHTKRTQSSPISPYPQTPQSYNVAPPFQQQQQPPQSSFQNHPPQYHLQGQHPLAHQQPPQQQQPPQHYPYPHAQQQPPQVYPHQQPPAASAGNSSTPNLQQLLANLRQPSDQGPAPNPAPAQRQPDLGGLLTNIAAHQRNHGMQPYTPVQQQQHQHQLSPQLYNHSQTPTSAQPNNVQSIMDQLARYQR
jgi:hypothetical protein